jgi:hypothetical protein
VKDARVEISRVWLRFNPTTSSNQVLCEQRVARVNLRIAELRWQHPDKGVERWAEDEARLGLEPIVPRVGAVRGRRNTAHGRTKYRWLYVYGFVHPASGRDLELLLPAANAD